MKKLMMVLGMIVSLFLGIGFTFIFLILMLGGALRQDLAMKVIVIGVPALICYALFFKILKCYKKQNKTQTDTTQAEKTHLESSQNDTQINENSIIKKITARHISGLPMGEGASCSLYLYNNKVVFEKDAASYSLLFEKIADVTVKSDMEIRKSYVSSAGGAVGGALLFGPVGAMIGGRIQEKTDATFQDYLIFTYYKNGNPEYIWFEVSSSDSDTYYFPIMFQKYPKETKEIEL